LGAGRDLNAFGLVVDCLYAYLGPEDSIDDWELLLGYGVVALSFEEGVALDNHLDDEVARDVPLASEFERGSVVDAPGELDFLLGLDSLHALAGAGGARGADDLPATLASFALHPHHHDSLLEGHEARALAALAFLRFGARLGFTSFAGTAGAPAFVLDVLLRIRYTLLVPLTASLNSSSIFTAIFSGMDSSPSNPPLLPLPFFEPPPMPPPKRSANKD
jgi:hypothetical protein